jgi:hypothetical protein
MDGMQQLDISISHMQTLQRVQDLFEARHGILARLRGSHDHETAVNVGLLCLEGTGAILERSLVMVGGLFRIAEMALGMVNLLFEQTMLGVDVGQQLVQRLEVADSLQLVVEIVGHARLYRVKIFHLVRYLRVCRRTGIREYGKPARRSIYTKVCQAMCLGASDGLSIVHGMAGPITDTQYIDGMGVSDRSARHLGGDAPSAIMADNNTKALSIY